jgi:hypothetical protein
VTGQHLDGTPKTIEDRHEQLGSVVRRVLGDQETTNGHRMSGPASVDNGLTDDEVVWKALSASNGERFARL